MARGYLNTLREPRAHARTFVNLALVYLLPEINNPFIRIL